MAKKKPTKAKSPPKKPAGKRSAPAPTRTSDEVAAPPVPAPLVAADQNGAATAETFATPPRLFPTGDDLKSLYNRYTGDAKFDDHDKAFYFVLDVGGVSRAKQLISHVEEVLAEIEEFH